MFRHAATHRTDAWHQARQHGQAVSQDFDDALATAGGSRSTWLVLMSLKAWPVGNQRQLAAVVGIQGATLTQHLNTLESDGLLTRRRDPPIAACT